MELFYAAILFQAPTKLVATLKSVTATGFGLKTSHFTIILKVAKRRLIFLYQKFSRIVFFVPEKFCSKGLKLLLKLLHELSRKVRTHEQRMKFMHFACVSFAQSCTKRANHDMFAMK